MNDRLAWSTRAASRSDEETPAAMSFASASGATSSHDAASGGLSDSAPTSKYTARRVKVADLRMRSASPLVENVGAPSASTVCSSMLSRVMPSANRSRGAEAAAETSPSSPSSRRWIRCTVTSRFPRMVSSIPAKYPSPLPDVDAADCAATASFAAGTDISASPPASHAVSPASTSSRVSSARARSSAPPPPPVRRLRSGRPPRPRPRTRRRRARPR